MKCLEQHNNHWPRRALHLCIGLAPLIYYWFFDTLSLWTGLSSLNLLFILAFGMILVESERLYSGRLYFSQREYERVHLSSGIWTGLGLITVFIFAPAYNGHKAAFGLPIIWCLTLGDPLIGECRQAGLSMVTTIAVALFPLTLIWLIACFWFSLPLWLVCVLPALAIAGEWPSIKWIDDNFMMMCVPLVFTCLIFSS
ncbi:MAG: hypothetical protein ACHP6H_02310 [Legionellales bacterium]